MARLSTDRVVSPYYPPRARWYSRVLYLWFALHGLLHLVRIHLPGGLSFSQFALSLVVPGFAFSALGRRSLGRLLLAAYCIAGLLFVTVLGYPTANLGFGLMIGAHATSIIFLEGYWLRDHCRLPFRLALAIATLLVVWLAVYWPMVLFVEGHWIVPLRVGDRVVVVSRATSPQSLQRGDWVAYRVFGPGGRGLYVRGGLVFGPVLAIGGDRVQFGTNGFKVNGRLQSNLPNMPTGGEVSVPENHWFLWPNYAITGGHGEVNPTTVSGILLQMAIVSQDQFIGRPYQRWFWRRQSWQPAL